MSSHQPDTSAAIRVLLVDDEDDQRIQIARQLERAGDFEIHEANCGADALRCAQKLGGENLIVLMDYGLPDLNGIEAMRQLRAQDPIIQVIMFTGRSHEEGVEALREGAYRYIMRPFKREELWLAIRNANKVNELAKRDIADEWQRQLLNSLRDFSAIATAVDTDGRETVQRIAHSAVQAIHQFTHDDVALWYRDGVDEEFKIWAHVGLTKEYVARTRVGLEDSVTGEVLASGEPAELIDIFDRTRKPRPFKHREQAIRAGWKSVLILPLLVRVESYRAAIGAISVYSKIRRPFANWEKSALYTFVNQTAIAIDNAQKYTQIERQYDIIRLQNDQLGRQVRELQAVSLFQERISNLMPAEQQLEEIYAAAVEAMSGIMDTRNMYIALLDEAAGVISFPLTHTDSTLGPAQNEIDDAYAPRKLGERQSLTEYVLTSRKPLLIGQGFDRWSLDHPEIQTYPLETKCWLGAPIIFQERVLGVIAVQSFEREEVFDEQHKALLATIASQTGIAIDNARQYALINHELKRRIRELEAVSRFQQKISTLGAVDQEVEEIHQAVASELAGLMDAHNMYIVLLDEGSGEYWFALTSENSVPVIRDLNWQRHRIADRKGLIEWVIEHRESLLIQGTPSKAALGAGSLSAADAVRDFELAASQHGIEATAQSGTLCWLGAPMVRGDKVLGVIGLSSFNDPQAYDEHHRQILETVAGQAAVVIENSQLVQKGRIQRLRTLPHITRNITQTISNPEGVLKQIAATAVEATACDAANVYLWDAHADRFASGVRARKGEAARAVEEEDLPDPDGEVAARIVSTRRSIYAEEEADSYRRTDYARRNHIEAFAGLPLTVRDDAGQEAAVGVLFVNYNRPIKFDVDQKEMLTHLASQAAITIAYTEARRSAGANQQLAALGAAAGALQHRLSNTVSVILPTVTRLRFRTGEDREVSRMLDLIERNAEFATEVIRRMYGPLQQEAYVQTNINGLIADAVEQCRAQFTATYPDIIIRSVRSRDPAQVESDADCRLVIGIACDLADEVPASYARSSQLGEVFRVLIENGVKAILPASGVITVTSRLNRSGLQPQIEVHICDSGKGIDDNTRSRLFDQPVHRSDFGQGTGLGLWLSGFVVRSHRGIIRLTETKLGQGSTFSVRLPVLDRPPTES